MKVTADEVLRYVIEWLGNNAPELLSRLYDDVPPAKTILAGPSAAEVKLAELRRLEGTED